VDYVGSKQLEQSKIDDKLKEEGVTIRLDSFIDPALVRKVEGIVRDMMSEKGYQFAEVTHEIKELPTGPKLVHLSFNIKEGPKVKIRHIEFTGNKQLSNGELTKQMKENRPQHWLSFITGRGTYQEPKFEEDAARIQEHYANEGYINARIGTPEVKVIEDSKDAKTRYIELKIPVSEGDRYKVGELGFDGNKTLKAEALRPLFQLQEGQYFSMKKVRKGMDAARELYGSGGYWEFTGYPDLKPRNLPDPTKADDPKAIEEARKQPAIVDVTLRLQEGEQYFVNRITFTGNTTTRDSVVRREMRLLENGVFNTGGAQVQRQADQSARLLQGDRGRARQPQDREGGGPEEQGRRHVEVPGAEPEPADIRRGRLAVRGFFRAALLPDGQLPGRGESVTFAVMAGSQVQNYQLAFSEPYLFDRPITAGINLYSREIRYYYSYTQDSLGGASRRASR
jgi:outer membrane protein insertion porin family